jgi:hypothetical protein
MAGGESMNQDQVREKLLKLHTCTEEFTVVFSGKKSKTINGLYKPDKNEIIIHNRNFPNDETGDNLLFYTAMHELAHHIQFTEYKQESVRSHTELFYATLDDLVDEAEEQGLYKTGGDEETQKLIDEARDISREIALLQKKLGSVLLKLHERCQEKGIRYEDVIERKVQISLQTMKKANKACTLDLPEGIGADIQAAAIKEKDEGKREAILNAGKEGKSVAQAKRSVEPPPPEDETERLEKEKSRIERTIASLNRRLEEIMRKIQFLEEGGGIGNPAGKKIIAADG